MAILKNYAIQSIKKISCSGYDGKHVATIRQLKNGTFSNGRETIDATGENGIKLAQFQTNESVTLSATSGLISEGGFILSGENVTVKQNATGYMVEEICKTADGNTVTLKHKASGTAGNEIKYIYACDESGNIDPDKVYEQDSTASATKFSYIAETKTITLPTSAFSAGQYVLVKYFPTFSELTEISRKVSSEPFEGEVRVFCLVKCLTDNLVYRGQIYIPRGRFTGTYDLAFGDAAAVQDFNIEALPTNDEDGDFWKLYVVKEDDIVDA